MRGKFAWRPLDKGLFENRLHGMTKVTGPMDRARLIFHKSGLSLNELGKRMGYSSEMAKKSAWQFLHKTTDPRFSMLKRFADAMNVSITNLVK